MVLKTSIILEPHLDYHYIKSTWHIWESAVAAICHPLEASTTAKLQFSSLLFRIFLSLMEAAGLTDVLRQEGGFTLFAPSDKAFAGLSERDMAVLKSKFTRHFCLFICCAVKV